MKTNTHLPPKRHDTGGWLIRLLRACGLAHQAQRPATRKARASACFTI